MMKFKHVFVNIASTAFDMWLTFNRIILLVYCNLTIAFIVLLLDKGGTYMKKYSGGIIALLVSAMVAIAGVAYEFICFYRQFMGPNM
jgi:hypothetical protein